MYCIVQNPNATIWTIADTSKNGSRIPNLGVMQVERSELRTLIRYCLGYTPTRSPQD